MVQPFVFLHPIMRSTILSFLAFALITTSCSKHSSNARFQLVEDSGIDFTNTVTDNEKDNVFKYRNFYNGGGVAIGDINNDGLADVFMTSNQGDNKLYLNKGNFKFEDISVAAGFGPKEQWSTGVVMVDINNDGWLDIYVCNAGHMQEEEKRKNQLFINNQHNHFTEEAEKYGLADKGYTTHASFFDYDHDGDLDCFLVNNSPIPVTSLNYVNARDTRAEDSPVKDFLKAGGDHLYQNNNGLFKEVSKETGIHGSLISFGLGVTVGDVNGDGWLDVYVSNDFFERDYLYVNQKNGTFKDELENWMEHNSTASMGTDMADINNDGYPDIFTTEMLPDDEKRLKTTTSFDNIDVQRLKVKSGFHQQFMHNSLQLNNQHGGFHEIAYYAGVQASDWSWGELTFDADNDGFSDIYVSNGIIRDLTNQDFIDFFANDMVQTMVLKGEKKEVSSIVDKMPSNKVVNKMFRNQGDLRFTEMQKDWGMDIPSFSNGAAYGDLDNDGDLDIIVNNINQPAFIYRNNTRQTDSSHYIGFTLRGNAQNSFAVGAKVIIYAGKHILSREMIPARGFQSSIDYKMIIGLGAIKHIDSAVVVWPDSKYSHLQIKQVDTVLHIEEQKQSELLPYTYAMPGISANYFEVVSNDIQAHKEDDHVDFYAERLIPKMISREGPAGAVGDINGDGLDDVFIGGATDQPGAIYIQQPDGKMIQKATSAFAPFASMEDVVATFFDADGDKDLDLFIGAGGNNKDPDGAGLEHRLFLNDGKGGFTYQLNAFPHNGNNIGAVVPLDVDGDGDMDLFVGSRSTPFKYGVTPSSYLYVNKGNGIFEERTKEIAPDLAQLGMVTDAVLASVVSTWKKDLVVVGEWMSPKVFTIEKNHLTLVQTNLDNLHGWWQSVAASDLDKDGKEDLVFGNYGENGYFRNAEEKPFQIWVNDFDQNGTLEKILTKTIDGKEYPVFLKGEMQEQIPLIKKENLRYEDYANKTFQQLFNQDLVAKAEHKIFNYSSSIIAWNTGAGKFNIQKLPAYAQFSTTNAISVLDVDHDGKNDLVLGGNEFDYMPQFGRNDASFGTLILNKGSRTWNIVPDTYSGLYIKGEVNGILSLNGKTRNLLFLRNNDTPVLLRTK